MILSIFGNKEDIVQMHAGINSLRAKTCIFVKLAIQCLTWQSIVHFVQVGLEIWNMKGNYRKQLMKLCIEIIRHGQLGG
jgi:hypothetical protein